MTTALTKANTMETLQLGAQYVPGSIVRIKLKDFMTFDVVEVFPGARLNILIGPNGNGKSSIVSAISLGLGGEHKDLNRAESLQSFIKRDREVAVIEIELFDPAGKNLIITRTIAKNKNSWMVNGKVTTHTDIMERMKALKISVNNLCQFLPQDRVGEFSKFDEYQLLKETVRAVCGEKQVKDQEAIAALQKELSTQNKDVAGRVKELDKLKAENEQAEAEVERQNARTKCIKDLELLQKLRPWVLVVELASKAKDLAEKKKQQEAQLKALEGNLDPIRQELNQVKSKKESVDREDVNGKKNFEVKFKSAENESAKLEKLQEGIFTAFLSYNNALEEENKTKEKIADLDRAIEKLEKEIQKYGTDDSEMKKKLVEIKKKLNDATLAARPLETSLGKISADFVAKSMEVKTLQKKIELLNPNHSGAAPGSGGGGAASQQQRSNPTLEIRFSKLKGMENGLGSMRKWVMANQANFVAPVVGPIALLVEPKDGDNFISQVMEDHIREKTWSTFIANKQADHEKFTEKARTPGFASSCVNAEQAHQLRCPFPKDKLIELGILGSLDEFMVTDPVTLKVLRATQGVERVLIGGPKLVEGFANKLMDVLKTNGGNFQEKITVYTLRMEKHEMNRSHYDREVYTSISKISDKGRGKGDQRLFALQYSGNNNANTSTVKSSTPQKQGPSPEELKKLNSDLARLKEEAHQLELKKKQLQDEKSDSDAQMKALREQEGEVSKQMKSISSREGTLKAKKAEKKELEEDLNENLKDDIEDAMQKILASQTKYKDTVRELVSKAEELVTSVATPLASSTLKEVLFAEYKFWEQFLKSKEEHHSGLRKSIDETKTKYDALLKELRKLKEEAQKATNGRNPADIVEMADLPRQLDAIDALMASLNAQIAAIRGDSNIVKEYEDRKKDIERKQKEVDDFEAEMARLKQNMETMLFEWEKLIGEKVDIIDSSFSKFFNSIGRKGFKCVGEVKLKKNPDDVAKYGIALNVSFRDDQKLQQLRSDVHSGGERSLATFLYMLSLQKCAACPFRVVDEINQGMDATKERLAYDQLVSVSTGDKNLPQYFIVTPKLLPGLNYTRDTKVLIVLNGVGNVKNWDFPKRTAGVSSTASEEENENTSNKRARHSLLAAS